MSKLTWRKFLKFADRVTGLDQAKGYDFKLINTRSDIELLIKEVISLMELLLPQGIFFEITQYVIAPASTFIDLQSTTFIQTPVKVTRKIVFRTTKNSCIYTFEPPPSASSHFSGREVYKVIQAVIRLNWV